MANGQVSIRFIEEARGSTLVLNVWKIEKNVSVTIGTLIVDHVWRESTLIFIFLQSCWCI